MNLSDRLFEAIAIARYHARNDGSAVRMRHWDDTASKLRAAIDSWPAWGTIKRDVTEFSSTKQVSEIERGLAEKDAELHGVGFLIDGIRVTPEWVTIIYTASGLPKP